MTNKALLRTLAKQQAEDMFRVLDRRVPGAAIRLAEDALGEMRGWPTVEIRIVPESQVNAPDCSIAGSYLDVPEPPVLVVSASASRRRRQFTALHELGHHLQQTDDDLGEAVLAVADSKAFEDAACDAFAAQVLLPNQVVSHHIGDRGPTADMVAELHHSSQASRAACCVRAAQRLIGPGAVVLFTPSGEVSFAAGSGGVYPPARGTDQSATPLLQSALPRLAQDHTRTVSNDNTTIIYRDGSRYESLYGQAAWCDGYVVAVLTEDTVPWKRFALPSNAERTGETGRYWHCEVCQDLFERSLSCPTCVRPKCPVGHCGCTTRTELVCSKCFMSLHKRFFPSGSQVCNECLK